MASKLNVVRNMSAVVATVAVASFLTVGSLVGGSDANGVAPLTGARFASRAFQISGELPALHGSRLQFPVVLVDDAIDPASQRPALNGPRWQFQVVEVNG